MLTLVNEVFWIVVPTLSWIDPLTVFFFEHNLWPFNDDSFDEFESFGFVEFISHFYQLLSSIIIIIPRDVSWYFLRRTKFSFRRFSHFLFDLITWNLCQFFRHDALSFASFNRSWTIKLYKIWILIKVFYANDFLSHYYTLFYLIILILFILTLNLFWIKI